MGIFNSHTIAAVNYIECPVEIDQEALRDLDSKIRGWQALPARIHVLDFRRVKKVTSTVYPIVKSFQKSLRDRNFRLVSINIDREIETQFSKDGVLGEFGVIHDLKAFLNSKTTQNVGEDEVRQTVIKAIVESSRKAVETLLNATVAVDENFIQNLADVKLESFFCAAILDSRSKMLKAQFRLYFSKETIFELTRSIIGPADTDEETATSTATELLNMIYGGAKAYLNDEKGYNLPPCIPSLVLKSNLPGIVRTNDPRRCICIPLVSPLGTFFAEIDFG